MTSDDVWRFLQSLKDRKFATLDQRKRFTLTEVGNQSLTVRVEDTGFNRKIERSNFEDAWERLCTQGRLARTEIQREISMFNPAYVASLLAELPGVGYTLRPIVLVLTKQGEHRSDPAVGEPIQSALPDVGEVEDEENPGAEAVKESVADRLAEYGRTLDYEVRKEWRTDIGNRIDLVWAKRVAGRLPGFPEGILLPVVGFEVETSLRSRKHVKGDIFNLQDLSAALGVIVLCRGPNNTGTEIASLRNAAERYVKKLGLRIQIWSDEDVERFCRK